MLPTHSQPPGGYNQQSRSKVWVGYQVQNYSIGMKTRGLVKSRGPRMDSRFMKHQDLMKIIDSQE
jgi:hypothetical protein